MLQFTEILKFIHLFELLVNITWSHQPPSQLSLFCIHLKNVWWFSELMASLKHHTELSLSITPLETGRLRLHMKHCWTVSWCFAAAWHVSHTLHCPCQWVQWCTGHPLSLFLKNGYCIHLPEINKVSSHLTATSQGGLSAAAEVQHSGDNRQKDRG